MQDVSELLKKYNRLRDLYHGMCGNLYPAIARKELEEIAQQYYELGGTEKLEPLAKLVGGYVHASF